MKPLLQSKILRFLETQTFMRVGGEREIKVDVRIIAATNRNLETLVKEESFRKDLYYRLKVMVVEMPPTARPTRGHPCFFPTSSLKRITGNMPRMIKGFNDEARAADDAISLARKCSRAEECDRRAMILTDQEWITPDKLPFELQGRGEIDSAPYGKGKSLRPLRTYLSMRLKRAISQGF